MSNEIPYLGSKISLISKAEIRYEGVLYSIDANESTVALAKVRSFGTEDRHTDHPVQPRDEIFEYIIFRGTDIKDLHVCDTNKLTPQDPAIVQSSMSSSQINSVGSNNVYPFGGGPPPPPAGSYPAQQMPSQYPPYNAFGGHSYQSHSNYQGSHSQFSGAPSTHSDSRSPSPPPQQLPQSLTNSNAASINVGGPNDYSPAILDERTRGGSSRGGAYNRGTGRYSDYPQGVQQMGPSSQHQPPPPPQQQQNYINREYVRSDYQQQQQHRQQQQQRQQSHHSYLNNRENGPSNIRYNKENYPSQYPPSAAPPQQQQQYRDSSPPPSHQQQRGYPSNSNNVTYMKSSPGSAQQQQQQHQYDYRLQRGRGPTRGYFNSTSNLRLNRGGHMIRGSSRGYGGRPGYMRFGRPGVLKFDSEFDFESSNAQFDKCQIEKELKEKLKIESKDQSSGDDPAAVDGEGDDVNGEVGQSGHSAYYDKNKSFFDSISCEALDTNGSAARTNWREERKLNFETFGLRGSNGFRGRYRGRGGGGSYSRGYGGMDNGYHSNRGGYGSFRGGDRSWANQYSRGGGRSYRGGGWNKQPQQQQEAGDNRIVESTSLNNQPSTIDK